MRTLLCFFLAAQIYAADPRLGTWKLVSIRATMDPPTTMTFTVESGGVHMSYVCCAEYSAKLDDHAYPVKGSTAYDQVSLHLIDANTIDGVRKKDGKETATVRYQVSDRDPNQLRMTITPTGGAAEYQFFNRKGQSTNASNKVIGTWVRDESKTAQLYLQTLQFTAEGSSSVRCEVVSEGVGYTAALDGKDSTSLRNDPLHDSVAVHVIDADKVEDVFKAKGKVVETVRYTVSDGGKTLTVDDDDHSDPGGRKEQIRVVYQKE
jgi:hypothetical protein